MHKYIIYDGPGILTTFIRITQSNTKCSTFQCTIQLLVQNVLNDAYFRFYSIPLPFSDSKRTIQGTNDFVDFPNKKCLNYVCILSVVAEYQQQVNVTIYKINSVSLYDPTCIFSGVTTAETIQDDYKQSETLCENHDGTKNTSRSFYSQNSSLIMVLYWYKGYSRIQISVHISQTRRKPVLIDACYYYYHCVYFDMMTEKCLLYLTYITQYSWINISHGEILSFTQFNGTCTLFIIFNNNTVHGNFWVCFIQIKYRKSQIQSYRRALSFQHDHIGFVSFQGLSSNSDYFLLFEGEFTQPCNCWVEIISIQSNIQHITGIEYLSDALDTPPVIVEHLIKPNYVFVLQIQHNASYNISKESSVFFLLLVKHHTYIDYYYNEFDVPSESIYVYCISTMPNFILTCNLASHTYLNYLHNCRNTL